MTQATVKPTASEKYTQEQTTQLLSIWAAFCSSVPDWATIDREKADKKIAELAEQFQKKQRSIIAKLTRHNAYIAKTQAKSTSEGKTKQELAEVIGKVLNLSTPEVDSLSVAGKQALTKIMTALAGSVPVETLTPAEQGEKMDLVTKISENLALQPDTLRDISNLKLSSLHDLYAEVDGLTESFESKDQHL